MVRNLLLVLTFILVSLPSIEAAKKHKRVYKTAPPKESYIIFRQGYDFLPQALCYHHYYGVEVPCYIGKRHYHMKKHGHYYGHKKGKRHHHKSRRHHYKYYR